MARVKYYINNQEPDAVSIADALREAGIDFDGIPTSGPMMLVIDDVVYYGPTDVNSAVRELVESPPEYLLVR